MKVLTNNIHVWVVNGKSKQNAQGLVLTGPKIYCSANNIEKVLMSCRLK